MDDPMKPTAEESDSSLTVRIPTALHNRFRELAAYHGRSVSEEVKWAMVIFDAQTTLAELQHPEAVVAMGEEAHLAAVAEVKRDLRDYLAAALPPKEREPVLL
jgi:plasmid stability protein